PLARIRARGTGPCAIIGPAAPRRLAWEKTPPRGVFFSRRHGACRGPQGVIMPTALHRFLPILLLASLFVPPAAHSRPSPADYERAIGLRGAWEGLTEDVADPAVWDADRLFHYRKAVRGGHRFVAYDMERQVREPAFDHDRL